jgi:hypothetical protein
LSFVYQRAGAVAGEFQVLSATALMESFCQTLSSICFAQQITSQGRQTGFLGQFCQAFFSV